MPHQLGNGVDMRESIICFRTFLPNESMAATLVGVKPSYINLWFANLLLVKPKFSFDSYFSRFTNCVFSYVKASASSLLLRSSECWRVGGLALHHFVRWVSVRPFELVFSVLSRTTKSKRHPVDTTSSSSLLPSVLCSIQHQKDLLYQKCCCAMCKEQPWIIFSQVWLLLVLFDIVFVNIFGPHKKW